MVALPIPCVVDLVHAFNGVVMEHLKRDEKIPQWFDSSFAIAKATFQTSTLIDGVHNSAMVAHLHSKFFITVILSCIKLYWHFVYGSPFNWFVFDSLKNQWYIGWWKWIVELKLVIFLNLDPVSLLKFREPPSTSICCYRGRVLLSTVHC